MYKCVVKERDRCREKRETETERKRDRQMETHTEDDCIVYAVQSNEFVLRREVT